MASSVNIQDEAEMWILHNTTTISVNIHQSSIIFSQNSN